MESAQTNSNNNDNNTSSGGGGNGNNEEVSSSSSSPSGVATNRIPIFNIAINAELKTKIQNKANKMAAEKEEIHIDKVLEPNNGQLNANHNDKILEENIQTQLANNNDSMAVVNGIDNEAIIKQDDNDNNNEEEDDEGICLRNGAELKSSIEIIPNFNPSDVIKQKSHLRPVAKTHESDNDNNEKNENQNLNTSSTPENSFLSELQNKVSQKNTNVGPGGAGQLNIDEQIAKNKLETQDKEKTATTTWVNESKMNVLKKKRNDDRKSLDKEKMDQEQAPALSELQMKLKRRSELNDSLSNAQSLQNDTKDRSNPKDVVKKTSPPPPPVPIKPIKMKPLELPKKPLLCFSEKQPQDCVAVVDDEPKVEIENPTLIVTKNDDENDDFVLPPPPSPIIFNNDDEVEIQIGDDDELPLPLPPPPPNFEENEPDSITAPSTTEEELSSSDNMIKCQQKEEEEVSVVEYQQDELLIETTTTTSGITICEENETLLITSDGQNIFETEEMCDKLEANLPSFGQQQPHAAVDVVKESNSQIPPPPPPMPIPIPNELLSSSNNLNSTVKIQLLPKQNQNILNEIQSFNQDKLKKVKENVELKQEKVDDAEPENVHNNAKSLHSNNHHTTNNPDLMTILTNRFKSIVGDSSSESEEDEEGDGKNMVHDNNDNDDEWD